MNAKSEGLTLVWTPGLDPCFIVSMATAPSPTDFVRSLNRRALPGERLPPRSRFRAREIHVWRGDRMVIQLEKFGPSTQESTAVIATREWYDKTAED